ASMSRSGPTGVVSAHRLQVGRHLHGHLTLLTSMSPAPVDQLLLGHAASLICLEQEKPLRLREAQNRFNEMLVGLILDGALTGPQTAEHLRAAGLAGADANPAQAPAGICLADQGPDLAGALELGIPAARVAALRGAALVNADSMAGYTLIAQPAARAALTALARERLGPLADTDRPGDVDLLGTLCAFLEHNGHWESASSDLHVHRHTLHKRVDRIELLLGVDLDSAHVRAELLLCLSAWSADGRHRTTAAGAIDHA
ncbi:MAG: helix-turn-helix domain-containing protein, partial [Nakamurella sp.]